MPRKTRQEKILSQLRRLQREQTASQPKVEDSKPVVTTINLGSLDLPKAAPSPIKSEPQNYSYVFSDLRKTLIFAAAAITFQVILSFII